MSKILLINDMAGYGKVATAAMLPIVSYFGHSVYNLPTALVSNTLDYGKFNILETTEYIKGVFPVWKQLGFTFDAIATGFIISEEQARIVSEYCREQSVSGTIIFVDPIMGDEGKLYNGVTNEAVNRMREMVAVANLVMPNYTEATLLAGIEFRKDGVSYDEAKILLDKLRAIGSKSVLITSIKVDGQNNVVGYNNFDGEYFKLPYTEIPVHYPGTGDIFSAVLIGHLLKGDALKNSTRIAMDAVSSMICRYKDNEDKNQGIPIEKCLDIL